MHPKMCAPTASKSSSLLPRPDPSDYPPCARRAGVAFYVLEGNERNRDWISILSFVEINEKRDWK